MINKTLLVLVNLLPSFLLLYAQQSIVLGGHVYDENLKAISDVHISCQSQQIVSNHEGQFELTIYKKNKIRCRFSHVGYYPLDTIFNDAHQQLKIVLKRQSQALDAVVIQDKVNQLALVNQSVVKPADLKDKVGQSLAQLLEKVPGVSTLRAGQNIYKPIIHGLHSQRVGIFVQGLSLEDHQWGYDHNPSVDLNAVDKIRVIKGSSVLQYSGDFAAGMIVMEQRFPIEKSKPNAINLFSESNGWGGGFALKQYWMKTAGWQYHLTLGAKKLGDRNTPDLVLNNTGSQQINAGFLAKKLTDKGSRQWRYAYFFNELGIYINSHLGNVTDLLEVINQQRPSTILPFDYTISRPKQMIHHHQLVYENKIFKSDNGYHLWTFGTQWNWRQEFDITRDSEEKRSALNLNLFTQDIQWLVKKTINGFDFNYGLQLQWQNNFANSPLGRRLFIPSFLKLQLSQFVTIEKAVSNKTTLELGIRQQYSYLSATKTYQKSRWIDNQYNENFAHFVTAEDALNVYTKPTYHFLMTAVNLGFKYYFENHWQAGTNFQFSERMPNVAELFSDGLHHSNAQIEIGNLAMQKEKSSKINAWIEKKCENLNVNFSTYAHYINDYVFLKPTGFETTLRGAFPVWSFVQTNAILMGFDFQMTYQWAKKWAINYQMAYVNGQDLLLKQPLIDMPPFNSLFELKFNFKTWQWLGQHQFYATQNRFPNFNFQTNIINNQNKLEPVIVDISTPPMGYHLFNFQISKTLEINSKVDAKLVLNVNNIFDQTYRDYLNRQRFFAEELGRNFLLQIQINY